MRFLCLVFLLNISLLHGDFLWNDFLEKYPCYINTPNAQVAFENVKQKIATGEYKIAQLNSSVEYYSEVEDNHSYTNAGSQISNVIIVQLITNIINLIVQARKNNTKISKKIYAHYLPSIRRMLDIELLALTYLDLMRRNYIGMVSLLLGAILGFYNNHPFLISNMEKSIYADILQGLSFVLNFKLIFFDVDDNTKFCRNIEFIQVAVMLIWALRIFYKFPKVALPLKFYKNVYSFLKDHIHEIPKEVSLPSGNYCISEVDGEIKVSKIEPAN